MPFDGRRFAAKGKGRFRIGTHRGNRVTYRWRPCTRNGKRLPTRCDSGARNWTAAMLRPIAPGG